MGEKNCPVCIWPWDPTSLPGRVARYGTPDADDEESVSDSQYLHALADVVRVGSVGCAAALCKRHYRELDEIVERNKTGRHPKRDPVIVAAERRLSKARDESEAAERGLELAMRTKVSK